MLTAAYGVRSFLRLSLFRVYRQVLCHAHMGGRFCHQGKLADE